MPEWFGGSALNSPTIPPTDQWKEQWLRLGRWHQRCQRVQAKSVTSELSQGDLDLVHTFFLNCFHLKDWIRVSHPELTNTLDDFFSLHFELGACRDLANGYKHKSLCRPTHDPAFNLYRVYDPFMVEIDPTRSPIEHRVAFADGPDVRKFELFELIDTCFRLWEDFISTELKSSPG